MTNLLDGDLKAVFGSVFSPLLLDATIHKITLTPNGKGGFTEGEAGTACKAMVEEYSEATRAAAGIPAEAVRLIVLQQGVGVTPNIDDEITVRSVRYAIKAVAEDPAQAAWTMQANPA